MAVGSGTPYNVYTGNGISTTYAYVFTVLSADDMLVTVAGVETTAYTISGIGDAVGGSITFDAAPANGAEVVLRLDVVLERTTDYPSNGDLLATTVNADFDRLWQALLVKFDDLSRALRVPEQAVALPTFPAVAARALRLAGFDADGNPTVVAPSDQSASALALLLASYTLNTQGVGAVGIDITLPYADGTLGAYLRQDFNVLHYIPRSQHAAILAGTSVTDVTTYVDQAIDAAIAHGGPCRVIFPTGKYKMDTALGEYVGAQNLIVDLQGSTLDFSGAALTGNGPLLAFVGTYGATAALTSNAAEGAQTISVNSSGFAVGDMVRIYSTELWDSTRTSTKCGEIGFIESIPGGASVTLVDPLRDAYATANTATLQKLTPIRDVHVRNGKIVGPGGDDQLIGVRLRLGLDCSLDRLHTNDIDLVHLRLTDCVHSWVTKCTVQEAHEDSQAYGISLQDACQDCSVVGNNGRDIRHFFTTNNNVSTSYGIVRGCLVAHNQLYNNVPNYSGGVPQTSGDAFDTHAGADDIHFWSNTIRGAFGAGINFEARSGTIRGNRITGATGSGIWFNPYNDASPGSIEITDNSIDGVGDDTATSDYGIVVTPQVVGLTDVLIQGNRAISKNKAVYVLGASGKTIGNLQCSGNRLKHRTETLTSQDTSGIDARYVDGGVIDANSVLARLVAIDLRNSSHVAVNSNRLEIDDDGSSGSPGIGVRCESGNYLNVVGNNIRYSNTGIASTTAISFNATNTVTNSDVRCNKTRGFTTVVNLGGGSGSVESLNT